MNQEFQNEVTSTEEITAVEQPAAPDVIESEPAYVAFPNPADESEDEPKPKKSVAKKIIIGVLIGILVVLIGLVIAGVIYFNKATAEVELPQNEAEASNMGIFAAKSAWGVLVDEEIVVDNNDLQMLVEKVIPVVNSSLEGTPAELKDLFCILENDRGTLHGQIYVGEVEVMGINLNIDETITFSADFDINYQDSTIFAQIDEIKCGTWVIPGWIKDWVFGMVADVNLPEGLTIEGSVIKYDVSGLDAMVDKALADLQPEALEGEINILGFTIDPSEMFDYLVEKVNAEITGADIVGDQLIINASAG
ncbi:MAG: hypothetical protein E7554_02210 [Ruminococcaceae bacterium]|nr:hypothetical protein [Oscillospiraceae bacterium]